MNQSENPNSEDNEFDEFEDNEDFFDSLDEMKSLTITRNEALYLSDSATLLLDHVATPGAGYSVPARSLLPSASVPVPFEIIHRLGLAVLLTSDPENKSQTCEMEFTTAELFLLRECCQSYVRINNEPVGYNLLRKVYKLILEKDLKERQVFDILTHDINMDFSLTEPVIERTEDGRPSTT